MSLENAIAFRFLTSSDEKVWATLRAAQAGLSADAADAAAVALAAEHRLPCSVEEWRDSASIDAELSEAELESVSGGGIQPTLQSTSRLVTRAPVGANPNGVK